MAMFDTLIDDLAGRYGLGASARAFVGEVLAMVVNSPDGVGGFLQRLKSGGLTSEVASWLGHPDAAPLSAQRAEQALGAAALGRVRTGSAWRKTSWRPRRVMRCRKSSAS